MLAAASCRGIEVACRAAFTVFEPRVLKQMRSTEHWLVHDHTKIEHLLRHCREDAEIFDWWSLNRYYGEFVSQLKYHMAQEEEVLFPAYNAARQPDHMVTDKLNEQHDEIVLKVRHIYQLIQTQKQDGLIDALADLVLLFKDHNQHEEHVILPFAAHLLYCDREELSENLDNLKLNKHSRVWGM